MEEIKTENYRSYGIYILACAIFVCLVLGAIKGYFLSTFESIVTCILFIMYALPQKIKVTISSNMENDIL